MWHAPYDQDSKGQGSKTMSSIVHLGGNKYEVEMSEEEAAKWKADHPPPQCSVAGWTDHHGNRKSIRNAKILDLYLQGLTGKAIAHIMGLTPQRVYQLITITKHRLANNLARFTTFTIVHR